jgi:hypothetical protein
MKALVPKARKIGYLIRRYIKYQHRDHAKQLKLFEGFFNGLHVRAGFFIGAMNIAKLLKKSI